VTDAVLALVRMNLRVAEGDEPFVYDDATGKPLKRGDTLQGFLTGGTGYNLTTRPLSPRVRALMLDESLEDAVSDLLAHFAWFLALDDVRTAAVIEIRFALGAAGFRGFPKMIAALARKDNETAANELALSKAAQHDWQPSRSVRLIKMLRTGTV
jgi:hypothetical protein